MQNNELLIKSPANGTKYHHVLFLNCSLLTGMSDNWEQYAFTFVGEVWNYQRAVALQVDKGFWEAGITLMLLTYIQFRTDWPVFQVLWKGWKGTVEKKYWINGKAQIKSSKIRRMPLDDHGT